ELLAVVLSQHVGDAVPVAEDVPVIRLHRLVVRVGFIFTASHDDVVLAQLVVERRVSRRGDDDRRLHGGDLVGFGPLAVGCGWGQAALSLVVGRMAGVAIGVADGVPGVIARAV